MTVRSNRFRILRMLAIALLLIAGMTGLASEKDKKDKKDTTEPADSTIADSTATRERPLVYRMIIEGAIGVVTTDFIAGAIEQAVDNEAEILIIEMDTPGGLMSSTWSICKDILNSPIPVCVYISPSGATAGSAGVYITYSAHFAAMAPTTNIGSAHPVSGDGEEIDSVMNEKITNDAVANIKASAERRGRNQEWAEQAVRESVSITDSEALELNVVDLRAKDIDDLLAQIHGRTAEIPSGEKTMYLIDPRIRDIEMTFAQKLLNIISSPNIMFLLFSLGGLGLMMELYHPGAIFPGAFGAICLLLAFYSSQVLPINYAGLALIFMAIVLFIMEIKIVSYGLLTIGGLISLFFGGLMLVDSVDPTLAVSISMLWTVVLFVGVIVGLLAWLVIRTASRQVATGQEGMIGKIAVVKSSGMVYVNGALWKAEGSVDLVPGSKVKIYAVESLTLKVKLIES